MEEALASENVQVAPVQEPIQNDTASETAPVAAKAADDTQEKNFRALRESKKELERKLKTMEEYNERLMKMVNVPSLPVAQVEAEDPDEDFIPKGKVKKVARKEVEPLEKKVQELEAQLNHQKQIAFFDNLKRRYSDFDDVVNTETIAILEEKDPELAQTIADLKDPYKIGVQTYKYIKAMNLSSKVDESRRNKEVDEKLAKNAKTMQTPQAFDKRPMAQAFKLTEEEKSSLYKEMMGYASQAGYGY